MNLLNLFQILKTDVLLAYKKQHPYFDGNWKTFSSQDILNLIDLIEKKVNQRVSEKWIYTHLKPDENPKLPRKDMLDILSQFVDYSGWDEYAFKHKKVCLEEKKPDKKRKTRVLLIIGIVFLSIIGLCSYCFLNRNESKVLIVKDAFTNKKIKSEEVKAVLVDNEIETPVEIIDSKIEVPKENAKVILKSPYYKDKMVVVNEQSQSDIILQPDDYAMMLKAFMKSDIKNWQIRKEQLQKILAEEVEIIIILKDNLGFEYFNKDEFSKKLIVPSASLKKMRLIDIQYNSKNEINFIRIIQE